MDSEATNRTRWISLILALMTAAFIMAKTGRDALYFMQDSLSHLPWIYLAIAMLSGPLAMTVIGLMRGLGSRRLRWVLPTAIASTLVLYHPVAEPGAGLLASAFFVYVPLIWGVLFSTAWLLGADLLDGRPRFVLGQAYARFGAASIAGGMLGGGGARLVASLCTPADLLLFSAALLVAAALLVVHVHRRYPTVRPDTPPRKDRPKTLRRVWRDLPVLGNSYARLMLGVAVLGGMVGLLIEYQFYHAATSVAHSGRDNVRFFASIYTALSAIALVVQLWLTPRLQARAGVEGSLALLPAGLLLGASAIAIGGGSLVLRSVLRLTEGGLKSSVHRSNWEQAYLGLPRTRRPMAKVVIDGMGSRAGEAMAAAILLLWIHETSDRGAVTARSISWMTWLVLAGSAAWIVATAAMRHMPKPVAAEPLTPERRPVPLPDS